MTDEIAIVRVLEVFGTVAGVLFAGLYGNRLVNRGALKNAEDRANASVFETGMAEKNLELENWKKSSIEGWQLVAALTADKAVLTIQLKHAQDEAKLRAKLVRKYPELAFVFDASKPGGLETAPAPLGDQ